ncbi:MAG: AMP-binding protein [Alphaproteobacteria bacterium]|nr:AMP-binding protein [Alphaproteobacteria bacterium]
MTDTSLNPFVGATYASALREIAGRFGDNVALVYSGRRWTFSEVLQEIDRAAARLWSLGLRAGDKVSIWLPNRPEFLWYWLGASRSGLVAVVLNTRLKADEAAYQIGQSDSVAVIVPGDGAFRDFLGDVMSIRDALPMLRHVIALDPTSASDVIVWPAAGDETLRPALEASDPEAPALISYSSGTTALPKGALITHCVFRKAWDIGIRVDMTERDRLIMAIPLFGSMAMMNGILPFWARGAGVVLAERFDTDSFTALVQEERCTMAHLLPPMILALARLPDVEIARLASLRVGFVLSNDQEILALVADRLRIAGVMTGYGLTEFTTVATRNRWDDPREARFETQGYALPDVEIRVVDPETGADCAPGTVGEVLLRGYCLMKGYYKKPAETARAIDKDGWFHTGDGAFLRADGRLTFCYRLGDGYKTNGFNVAPAEIESAIRRHPDVADVAVYGRRDPAAGEVGVACIVPREGAGIEEAAMLDFLRPILASYKMPRHVVSVPTLPRTAGTGKVQLFALREQVEPSLPKVKALA